MKMNPADHLLSMKPKLAHLQRWMLSLMVLSLGPSLSLSAGTFSDANWISMGGVPGTDGSVAAAVVDDSGNLYIGGTFTIVGDAFANRVAKWDGNHWTGLGSGMTSSSGTPAVYALAVSGTNLYAGGVFTTAGGSPATNIARWDGSSWSALGSGMNDEVHALAVSGNDVYAAGYFTTAGGSAANRIAKWDGTTWTPLGGGINWSVWALAASGSDVYAGGGFSMAGDIFANYIAKWDGSNWTTLGSGMNDQGGVRALVLSGSDLFAAGDFTWATNSAGATVPANRIAKWDGSSWSALGTGLDWTASALAVSGGNLYAGGQFFTAGGSTATRIAKWDGSSWSALGTGANSNVLALAASGSNVYAGGDFMTAGGSAAKGIARWNGNAWSALASGSGMNGTVYALAVSGTNVFAGGNFTTAGDSVATRVARWDGSSWAALGSGISRAYAFVYALAASETNLYVGGQFTISNWNGSSWVGLGSGISGNRTIVNALAKSGSNVYVGGSFARAGGITANYIAKWNGNSWSALGSGVDFDVSALAVSGGNVYAGGSFIRATNTGGAAITVNRIAKWDGTSWSALGSGLNDAVYALAISGSNMYAGGLFTLATNTGGAKVTVNRIARWDGSSWSALGLGLSGRVSALVVWGSDLYAAGFFTWATNSGGGTVTVNRIAKWDGNGWTALGSGIGGYLPGIWALAVRGDELYVGGNFATAGGRVSGYIARAYLPTLPTLSVIRSGGDVVISWPSADTADFRLEQADTVMSPASWGTNAGSVTDDGANKSVALPATNTAQFFRLRRP